MKTSVPLHVAIVLDRSGSMNSCRSDAVGAVNSYVRNLRDSELTADAKLTLVLFDSDGIDTIRAGVPVATCPELTPNEYVPRAMTPLLDAVGRTVAFLESQGAPQDRRILAVMTDGLENASREFSRQSIAALLKCKQEEGWLVAYLGANHDSWGQAEGLGIKSALTADFDPSALGASSSVMFSLAGRYVAEGPDVSFSETEREALLRASPTNDECVHACLKRCDATD